MTTAVHTDIAIGTPATAAVFNAPLGQLDASLSSRGLNLRDIAFGGKCDGVTNDQAAWALAVAAAGPVKEAIVFTGVSVVTANVLASLPLGIQGYGPGAILKVSGVGFHALTIPAAASGSWLQDFVIDGGASAPNANSAGVNAGSTTDILMRNVEIKNCGAKGLNTGGSPQRWQIIDCRSHDNYDEGALIASGGSVVSLRGCLMYNNGFNGLDLNSGQVSVENCMVYGNGNKAGVSYSSQVDRGGMVVFAANAITLRNGSITNCLFFSNIYHGLSLMTAAGGTLQQYTITNCQSFSNGLGDAVNQADGFTISAASGGTMDHLSVTGCLARANSRCGILVDTVGQVILTTNMVDANGGFTVGSQAGTGICVLNASPQCLVANNTVTNHTTQAATGISIFNVTVTDAQVFHNIVIGNTTPITDAGTRTTQAGNKTNITDNSYAIVGAVNVTGVITSIGAAAALRVGATDGTQGQIALSGGATFFDFLGAITFRTITGGTTAAMVLGTAGSLTASRDLRLTKQAPAFNAAPTPDASLGGIYEMAALTGAVNVGNPVNAAQGQRIRFYWKQDGTGGRAVAYTGSNWRSVGIAAQVTTLNTYTIDEAECLDGTIWRVTRLVTGQTV
jgi:hypothetical protein